MSENVIIALISSAVGVAVSKILDIFQTCIKDSRKAKMAREKSKQESLKEFKAKREDVYIAALDRLLEIRRGFDFTQEDVWHSAKRRETIEKDNAEYAVMAAKIRLYASDRVFKLWIRCMQMARFSYSSGQRLFENSKWNFDSDITILSRLMQVDLGYRKYDDHPEVQICPNCGVKHDAFEDCPKCKMTYEQTTKIMVADLKRLFEEKAEAQNNDSADAESSTHR